MVVAHGARAPAAPRALPIGKASGRPRGLRRIPVRHSQKPQYEITLKQLRTIYLSCCRLRASGALRIDPTCSLPHAGNMALAEGSTTPLSWGYSRSKPEVCTGPLG